MGLRCRSEETLQPLKEKLMSQPVIIIDQYNLFLRCFAAFPQMSHVTGEQIGGVVGFLRSLQRICNEIQPSRVYCAWEGGGSSKRRAIYSEYKRGRAPERLNRFYGDDLPESAENQKKQVMLLLSMLKCTPVCQLYVSDCEGDDLIAYLCKGPLKDSEKIIVSDDKDLWQLFNEKTWVYSPGKKRYVKKDDMVEQFRVEPRNFAIAKALCGDKGDNVPGIQGMGFKTCAKLFPMLGLDQDVLLSDVIDFAYAHRTENKLYQRVVDQKVDLQRNYRLVYLDGGMVPAGQQSLIDQRILNYVPKSDRMGLIAHLAKEGIGDFDALAFFQAFNVVMMSK